jgi:hypothetical protein
MDQNELAQQAENDGLLKAAQTPASKRVLVERGSPPTLAQSPFRKGVTAAHACITSQRDSK